MNVTPWIFAAVLAVAAGASQAPQERAQEPRAGNDAGFVKPDIVDNASFESGWDDFTNWSYRPPTGVTRDSTRAVDGHWSVHKELPATRADVGSQLVYPFAHRGSGGQDRIWTRFYFYMDHPISGGFKFTRYFDAGYNAQFSGLGVDHGAINVRFDPETGPGGTPLQVNIAAVPQLIGGWHWIETDYWRNGDPSGFPSMAIWLDGRPITRSTGRMVPPMSWVNGRLNAGKRTSDRKIGVFEIVGLVNRGNTVPGNIWIDKVSISTKGRIGP